MNVILDANALMMPFQYRINLDMEISRLVGIANIYVPSSVVGEIERISKKRWEAKAALQLLKKYDVCVTDYLGDRGVIDCAKKLGGYVVTNDRKLIKELRKLGIKVIELRGNHLVMPDD